MAVLTINREIIEKEGWTLGEFLLMMCAINKIDLESAKRLLIKKDYNPLLIQEVTHPKDIKL